MTETPEPTKHPETDGPDAAESTDSTVPADLTDSILSDDLTEPMVPADLTDSTLSDDLTEPTVPANTTKPTEGMSTTEQTEGTPTLDQDNAPIEARPITAFRPPPAAQELWLLREPPNPPVLSVPGVLVLMAVVTILYVCAGASAMAGMKSEDAEAQIRDLQLTVMISQWVVFLILPLILVRIARKDLRMIYSWHAPRIDLMVLTVAMTLCLVGVVQYAGSIAAMYLADPYDQLLRDLLPSTAERMAETGKLLRSDTVGQLAMGIMLVAITPAICEEHLFRGILQSSLDKRIPPVAAVVVAATIFAAFHLEPVSFSALLIVGLSVGVLTSRSGCILYAVLIHMANNTYAILMHVWMSRNVAEQAMESAGSFDSLPIYALGGLAGMAAFLARTPRRHRMRWHDSPCQDDPAVFRPGRWRRGSMWLARRWRLAAVFAVVCSTTGLALDVRDMEEIAAANPRTHTDDSDDEDREMHDRQRFELEPDRSPTEEREHPGGIHVEVDWPANQGRTVISAIRQLDAGAPGPARTPKSSFRSGSRRPTTTW